MSHTLVEMMSKYIIEEGDRVKKDIEKNKRFLVFFGDFSKLTSVGLYGWLTEMAAFDRISTSALE